MASRLYQPGVVQMPYVPANLADGAPYSSEDLITSFYSGLGGVLIPAAIRKLRVHGYMIDNSLGAAPCYVQFLDNDQPILGLTPPKFVVGVPAGLGAHIYFGRGIFLNYGLTFAATSTATGAGALASNVNVTVWYR